MTIEVTLGNQHGKIRGDIPEDVLAEIIFQCSYKVEGAEKSPLYRKKRWDGRKKLFDKRNKRFPMGLWSRIQTILIEKLVPYTVIDGRNKGITNPVEVNFADHVSLREYQQEVVFTAITDIRSILQVATGGGKTVIAFGLIEQLKCTTLFMVHTKDLLYQAKASFEEFLEGSGVEKIGQIGDGIIDVQPITIATTQSISMLLGLKFQKSSFDDANFTEKTINIKSEQAEKVKKFLDTVDLLIWDEVHRVACDMAYDVSEALTSPIYRVGLSASPWRDDGADIMIEACMGRVAAQIGASQLIEEGHLVPPVIRMHHVPASVHWSVDSRTYDQIYREEIIENYHRNHLILKYLEDFNALGMPTLILVQFLKHGRMLKNLIQENYDPIPFLSGKDLSEVRNGTIQEMREDRMGLIASTIADEGLDIKRLAGLIMAGGGKSSTRALQRIGRVLRPFEGKTHALIVDFYDEAKYMRDHAEKRMEIYRSEPKFHILNLEE